MNKLLDGYRRFKKQYFLQEPELFAQLASMGQYPATAVVACCDSRVDPAIIMDCEPGDLFIIRNVANLVPPYKPDTLHHGTSAALEFAVCGLKVRHIVVLGHAQRGGIQALLNGHSGDFITSWMSIADHARNVTLGNSALKTPREQSRHCEQAAICDSLKNLMTFPWIKERINAGALQLHGWYFDIGTGELLRYDTAQDAFAAHVP